MYVILFPIGRVASIRYVAVVLGDIPKIPDTGISKPIMLHFFNY